jgi:MFS family permease
MSLLVGERLGRRWCIMAGSVILSIGAVLQATSYGIPQMIVGRIVAGVGNGLNTSTIRRFLQGERERLGADGGSRVAFGAEQSV